MSKAYAYVRWSTADQQSGNSETRQLSALELFEESTGIPIEEIHYERGRSAFRGDNARRGELKALLDRISAGELRPGDYLVVESIDRITRERVWNGLQLLQNILKKGIRIYTTCDKKTYAVDDPQEDFQTLLMISVIAQRAHEESQLKSQRLLSAWNQRRAEARSGRIIIEKGNSIPYGLRVIDGRFVIDQEEQKEIRTLFEYLLSDGLNTAIKKINRTSKKRWSNGTLNKIIANRTVIGCMATHRTIHRENGKSRKVLTGYIEEYYPELIDPSLFYGAIDAMKSRKQKGYSGRRTDQDYNIFKNQIFCLKCGGKLYYDHRGSRYKGKIYPLFKCDTARLGEHACTAHNLRFEHVFGLLLSAIRNSEKVVRELGEFESISEGSKNLLGHLVQLKQKPKGSNHVYNEKTAELNKQRIKLENLNISIEGCDFKIPTSVMKQLAELEQKVDALKGEIEALGSDTTEFDFDLTNDEAVKDLFMSEDGRSRLNSFFKKIGITFHAAYEKDHGIGDLVIRTKINDQTTDVGISRIRFPKKGILKHYGLGDLQEIFDLKVREADGNLVKTGEQD